MDKIDFKNLYKDLYNPSASEVSKVHVPDMPVLMIEGQGDPAGPEFAQAVEALYGTAFTIKFWPKKHEAPKGYTEYIVPALEALWWTDGDGRLFDKVPRSQWRWTAMIPQPAFVTAQLVSAAKRVLATKKPNPRLSDLKFEIFKEGDAVQIMHIGPYSEEMPNLQKLEAYMQAHGLVSNGKHHEIYLGDPRRTTPEKLHTILRHPVRAS